MPSHDGLLKGNNFIETHVGVEEGLDVAEDGDGTVGSSSTRSYQLVYVPRKREKIKEALTPSRD